ncbi:electron transfer flavoprotein subunit beta/FixA family protein [Pseudomonas sp. CBSPBW29]|uniref:electron transfer flavoprotein subunit beta/FixA family protein n=1 Tax=Pseudomonas sp. CBS TaxID=2971912 RepID=UPI0021AD15F3|nr:electron transfer flavoprotein subunit beta/FixA family protein [Pseudomonas sp. CBS]WEL43568.1 electron transfer flavoprotein subunit beta/FixA family protein [Pseudomonas sp. CBSPBW29]WEL64640.1 electron transfer flavoprotein subunit beta/FixA family protein [Pseudomonas sp. CBSPGW29]WEL68105.1 electron transfer flavoprotein subunit beta/FixA family protein [Pseudomonas sp. CBSPCGW29]WEL75127.1 electron transfer flavoprotein subunit beta/FixA family protein [Pseudomonas sp. CBSPAW29]WEL89
MKVMVAVKRVLDANVKVRVKTDESDVELSNMKMSINPFCEIAVEAALQLKERGQASEIIAVSVGLDVCQEQLRTALAMGADRAVLIKSGSDLEPLAIAKLLNEVVKREGPGIVLLGKQSIDGDNNQTGQMLSALMGSSQGAFASDIQVVGEWVNVAREVDGGMETRSLRLPAVITADLRLNEPRYASLPNIMKAKKKPLEVIDAHELGVDITARLKVIKVTAPQERTAGVRVSSVDELVQKLKNEAGVI